MKLRPRQKVFVDRCIEALKKEKNTLGIAPTGSGKTVMLSHIIKQLMEEKKVAKVLMLVHRNELLTQNKEKFEKIAKNISTSVFNADEKNLSNSVVFATIQTFDRQLKSRLREDILAERFDFIVIDEAHHVVARTYVDCLDTLRNNKFMLLGVTATAERSDNISIGNIFTNFADKISINEMIDAGYLVPPKTFIINHEYTEALRNLKMDECYDEYNDREVAKILDKEDFNKNVVKTWLKLGDNRQTIIFCSKIEQAKNVTGEFLEQNVEATYISNSMPKAERKKILDDFERGEYKIIANVAILTEGYDNPLIGCVVLLRMSSYVSAMVQMIGRGLRIVDKTKHNNVTKNDCIVLDFGVSTKFHQYLGTDLDLPLKYYQSFEENIALINNEQLNEEKENEEKEKEKEKEYTQTSLSFDIENPNSLYYKDDRQKLIAERIPKDYFTSEDVEKKLTYKFKQGGLHVRAFSYYPLMTDFLGISVSRDEDADFLNFFKKENKIISYLGFKSANTMEHLINSILAGQKMKTLKNIINKKRKVTEKQLEHIEQYVTNYEDLSFYQASCMLSFFFSERQIRKILLDEGKFIKKSVNKNVSSSHTYYDELILNL